MIASVYIVDDDKLARESLGWLIDSVGLPVEAYHLGLQFLEEYSDSMTGCLVLDVRMPVMSGMDLYTELQNLGCSLPVIMMTGHADVALAVRAMKSGVYDFIEKPYNDAIMLERIQSAIAFDLDNRKSQDRINAVNERIALLTPREEEILRGILKSKPNKIIAADLSISIKTVELHRSNLMTKMQAGSATELVRLALIAGIDL